MRGHRRWIVVGATVAASLVAAALYWFQPWKLVTHSYLDEALPAVSPSAVSPSAVSPSAVLPSAVTPSGVTPSAVSPSATVLSRGSFVSGEHRTRGSALLVRLPDGRRVVRLEQFDTSDGPDVYVVLASTAAGSGGVGNHVNLGHLKATSGNQNYELAASVDTSAFRSVVIWCRRFDAVFGSAPLAG
jgi:hypothetical protein